MEVVFKVNVPQSVETGSSTLPGGDKEAVREAILSATTTSLGGSDPSISPVNPQVLLAILHRMHSSATPMPIPGMRGITTPDALVNALNRLAEQGVILRTDDGRFYLGGGAAPGGAPGHSHSHTPQLRHHRHIAPRERSYEPRARQEESREGKDAREQAPRERAPSEDGRLARNETPAEQKIREVLERAIAKYQERFGDATPIAERPNVTTTLDKADPQNPSSQQSPPSIDPTRNARGADTILTPSIRDALNDPRNDTARLLQQLLGNELGAPRSQPSSQSETHTTQTINAPLADARAAVNERLSQLRDALQVTMERSSPQPLTSNDRPAISNHSVANQGDFTRIDVPINGGRPTTNVQAEGRSSPNVIVPLATPADYSSSLTHGGAIRPVEYAREGTDSARQEKANNAFEALSKAAQKILSVSTLRSLENAAETAVLTAAAAIALGVMGSEIVLKEIVALSEEIMKRLRGEKLGGEKGEKELVELEKAIRELEEECADRGVETINQPAGLVADIAGTVKDDSTEAPLEGIEIDGGPLGVTYTNAQGEFIFKNVPLDQGFTIVARNSHYSFFPSPAIGTVSAATYLTIFAKSAQ